MILRVSETDEAKKWVKQFKSESDKSTAVKLLDSLRYISTREYESSLKKKLLDLQLSLKTKIAVYPVVDPERTGVDNIFIGSKKEKFGSKKLKKEKFGSEDALGYFLQKIEDLLEDTRQHSIIECNPTYNSIRTQGIKHIVLVDDISGSGTRFIMFYKKYLPKIIKRDISLGKIQIWFVNYAISDMALKNIQKELKYFKKNSDHILYVSSYCSKNTFSIPIQNLCKKYAEEYFSKPESAMGFKNSSGNIVFEHSCPNNVPDILWRSINKDWQPLFVNKNIPTELRVQCVFDLDTNVDLSELLWNIGQRKLALNLYDALNNETLSSTNSLYFTLIGLMSMGVNKIQTLKEKLLMKEEKLNQFIANLKNHEVIIEENDTYKLSMLGKSILERYKQYKNKDGLVIESSINNYYPTQCDGIPQISTGSL